MEVNLSREARLRTDERWLYTLMGRSIASHQPVNHSKDEYVRKSDPTIHTNTIEGYCSIFKRGMRGALHEAGAPTL